MLTRLSQNEVTDRVAVETKAQGEAEGVGRQTGNVTTRYRGFTPAGLNPTLAGSVKPALTPASRSDSCVYMWVGSVFGNLQPAGQL